MLRRQIPLEEIAEQEQSGSPKFRRVTAGRYVFHVTDSKRVVSVYEERMVDGRLACVYLKSKPKEDFYGTRMYRRKKQPDKPPELTPRRGFGV